jgi:hypothetical protein
MHIAMRITVVKCWVYLLLPMVWCLLSAPAFSAVTVNVFQGTVGATDNSGDVTTTDFMNDFGGGNLIGKSFVLTTTLDNSQYYSIDDPVNTAFITGGCYYNCYYGGNPITMTLTINGHTVSLGNSSDGFTTLNPDSTFATNLQAFYYNAGQQLQTQGINLNVNSSVSVLSVPLPAGLVTDTGTAFYDQTGLFLGLGTDLQVLNITSVNEPVTSAVPEPSTWAMMLLGFAGVGFIAYRRKSKPALMAA